MEIRAVFGRCTKIVKVETNVHFSCFFVQNSITLQSKLIHQRVVSCFSMSSKLSTIVGIIAHYKYLITIVVGVTLVGFVDENSFLQRIKYDMRISQLMEQIKKYEAQNEKATKELNALRRDPHAIEKIARERYFMQADDEDVFVLSTDKATDTQDDNVEDIAADETAQ